MQLKLYMLNKTIMAIISREFGLSGIIATKVIGVQKTDESLREKVGSALPLRFRLARLGGGTAVPPDFLRIFGDTIF